MSLATIRESIKTDLQDEGLIAVDYLPERFVPPVAVVQSGDPYIEIGSTFTGLKANYEVLLVADKSTNEVGADKLDAMILDAVLALYEDFETVSGPVVLEVNGVTYLAAQLNLSKYFELEDA